MKEKKRRRKKGSEEEKNVVKDGNMNRIEKETLNKE